MIKSTQFFIKHYFKISKTDVQLILLRNKKKIFKNSTSKVIYKLLLLLGGKNKTFLIETFQTTGLKIKLRN